VPNTGSPRQTGLLFAIGLFHFFAMHYLRMHCGIDVASTTFSFVESGGHLIVEVIKGIATDMHTISWDHA